MRYIVFQFSVDHRLTDKTSHLIEPKSNDFKSSLHCKIIERGRTTETIPWILFHRTDYIGPCLKISFLLVLKVNTEIFPKVVTSAGFYRLLPESFTPTATSATNSRQCMLGRDRYSFFICTISESSSVKRWAYDFIIYIERVI